MSDTLNTVSLDGQIVLNSVQNILPAIEALVPAAKDNAQLIQLSLSAATGLLSLIKDIPIGGSVSVQAQAVQLVRIYSILAGSPVGSEWIKQV